ncbi:hypothetical protein LguiB_001623 [Lonicera macranthoides]
MAKLRTLRQNTFGKSGLTESTCLLSFLTRFDHLLQSIKHHFRALRPGERYIHF